MVAELILKSKMLLPKQEKDPREDLVRVLMEYKAAKDAALWLSEREKDFSGRFEKDTDEVKAEKGTLSDQDVTLLTRALERLLFRMGQKKEEEVTAPIDKINPIIKRPIVPVSTKIISVLRFLHKKGSAHFDMLFESAESRSEIVAIFYATLELLKAGRVTLKKEFGDITNSNIILIFNYTHQREERSTDA